MEQELQSNIIEETLEEFWANEGNTGDVLMGLSAGVAVLGKSGYRYMPSCQQCAAKGCEACENRGVTAEVEMTDDVLTEMRDRLLAEKNEAALVTDDDRRAAMHDPNTPDQVKQFLKKHFYGETPNLKQVLHPPEFEERSSGKMVAKPLKRLNKPRRPVGMSGRQWKKMKKNNDRAVRQIMRGENIFAAQQGSSVTHLS